MNPSEWLSPSPPAPVAAPDAPAKRVNDKDGVTGDHLEAYARIATLVGLLLPFIGGLYREVALLLHGGLQVGLGPSLPLPRLAAIGGFVIVLAAILIAAYTLPVLIARWLGRRLGVRLREKSPERRRWVRRFMLLAAITLAIVLLGLILQQAILISVVAILAVVAIPRWIERVTRDGRPTFARLTPGVIVLVTCSAVVLATIPGPSAAPMMTLRMTAESGVPDGVYSILAEEGDHIFVLPCLQDSAMVRIRFEDVVTMTQVGVTEPPVTLPPATEILSEGLGRLGYVQQCPPTETEAQSGTSSAPSGPTNWVLA